LILVIDNYDSFVHNLARYLRELGHETQVVRNDAIDVAGVVARRPSHVVISPGPCTPDEAGISVEMIRELGVRIPTLGVCLGHQCIGQAYGGRVVRALRPMHGRTSLVRHVGGDVFTGLPNPLQATRYHSLVIASDSVPNDLEVAARTKEDGTIMAVRHRMYQVHGVQFHPESVLTEEGRKILRNFLDF